jgi:peptide-methionine (S)-S-oxide reductase
LSGHLESADRDRGRAARKILPGRGLYQDYYERNPPQRYGQIVTAPKVAKLRKEYLARLKR